MEKRLINIGIEFIKFGIVGVSNTLISLTIYYIFVAIDRDLYIIGNCVGFVVSVLNAYYWNRRYVFKTSNKGHIKAIARTFASYGFTFILSTVILYVMVSIVNVSEFIAPIVSLVVTIPVNFLLNKFWSFK